MGNFKRGGKFGGGNRGVGDHWSSNRGFGDRGQDRQMFKAVCDKCGQECEVPFRPTGERPVYCRECFKRDDGGAPRRFDARDSGRPSFGEKRMFEAICAKCGKRCEVPFRPTGEKPTYCRECFGKPEDRSVRGGDMHRAQFDLLNAKLDRILKAMNLPTAVAPKEEKPAVRTWKPEEAKKTVEVQAEPEKPVEIKVEAKKADTPAKPKKAAKKTAAKKKK